MPTTDPRRMNGGQLLDTAFSELAGELPPRAARALHWLRHPRARWVRVPLGLLLIVCAMFWFLPVIGIELLPIGLLLLAQDLPFLRRPAAHFILFSVTLWRRLKRRFHGYKRSRPDTRGRQSDAG